MTIKEQINREIGAHGERWNAMHDGYFSDPIIASPFINTINQYLSDSNADVLVDLGGGTGFILRELISTGTIKNLTPVNLDCSLMQLNAMQKSGIACVNGLISDFKRNDLLSSDKRIFFIMRSVLHYFGKDGLAHVLRHIRKHAKTGEMFIHQSACFENPIQARCINALYREMDTPKWYPTVNKLRDVMTRTNWHVIDIIPAPPLKLSSADLGQRYGLDTASLDKIRRKMMEAFGEIDDIFQLLPDAFTAYLHYRICIAKAA